MQNLDRPVAKVAHFRHSGRPQIPGPNQSALVEVMLRGLAGRQPATLRSVDRAKIRKGKNGGSF